MTVGALIIVAGALSGFMVGRGVHWDDEANQSAQQAIQFQKAFFDAGKVYGRGGCGDQDLAGLTATRSIETGLPASVIAAAIVVESSCNQLAMNHGAAGLMQVQVKTWAPKYDNFQKLNLFNREDSIHVGTEILAPLVKQYGLRKGLEHYNGSDDAGSYATRVLNLAGVK